MLGVAWTRRGDQVGVLRIGKAVAVVVNTVADFWARDGLRAGILAAVGWVVVDVGESRFASENGALTRLASRDSVCRAAHVSACAAVLWIVLQVKPFIDTSVAIVV